jgi:hypothetical protein
MCSITLTPAGILKSVYIFLLTRMNAEARERNSKTVRLEINQKRSYIFDPEIFEPERKTRDDGSEYTVIPYVVEDERFPG